MEKLDRENIEDIISLSPMQELMLFNYLSKVNSKQYNEQTRYRISGYIKPDLLKKAIYHVVQCNEMLRTVFRWNGLRRPIQIVLRNHTPLIAEYDFSSQEMLEAEKLVDLIEKNDREDIIDISTSPLRIILCKLPNEEYDMIITNHHIIFDGWSNAIILRELVNSYMSLYQGEKPLIAAKSSYKEFIKLLWSIDKSSMIKFWQEKLAGDLKKTIVPYRTNKKEDSAAEGYYDYTLSQEIIEGIYGYTKSQKVTLAALIYGIWAILLHKYTGDTNILFGITLAGRPEEIAGIGNSVGLYINTLPMRMDILPEEGWSEFIARVSEALVEMKKYELTSLADIQTLNAAHTKGTLFDSVVVIQNYPVDAALTKGNEIFNIKLHSRKYMTGISLTLGVRVFDSIILDVTYNSGLYDEDYIKHLIKHFEKTLAAIIATTEEHRGIAIKKKIADIEIVGSKEKENIMGQIYNSRDALKLIEEEDFDEVF